MNAIRNFFYARRLAWQLKRHHGVELVRANQMANELRSSAAKWPRLTPLNRKRYLRAVH